MWGCFELWLMAPGNCPPYLPAWVWPWHMLYYMKLGRWFYVLTTKSTVYFNKDVFIIRLSMNCQWKLLKLQYLNHLEGPKIDMCQPLCQSKKKKCFIYVDFTWVVVLHSFFKPNWTWCSIHDALCTIEFWF